MTLTATASAGSVFVGWSGACSGTSPCRVTTTAPRTVTAEFGTAPRQNGAALTVTGRTVGGTGSLLLTLGAVPPMSTVRVASPLIVPTSAGAVAILNTPSFTGGSLPLPPFDPDRSCQPIFSGVTGLVCPVLSPSISVGPGASPPVISIVGGGTALKLEPGSSLGLGR